MFAGDTTELHADTPRHQVFTRAWGTDGSEYVYLAGVAVGSAGAWVSFGTDSTGSATLLAASAVGPVAVSMRQNSSPSSYSWYQVYGHNSVGLCGSDIAANKNLYISGTTKFVDDLDVAQDFIIGAKSIAAGVPGGTTTFWLSYPYVTDIALD